MAQPGPWGRPEPERPERRGGNGWIWLVVALAGAGLAALLSSLDEEWGAELVFRLGVVVLIGGSLVLFVGRQLRGRRAQGLTFAAIWLGIVLVLALGYAYRGAFRDARDRLALELMPGGAEWAPGVVKVAPDSRGHYLVDGKIDGVTIRFLVDTGASSVVLTPRDAARVGLDPDRLSYNRMAETAAGRAPYASVRLSRVAIGQIELTDVPASVSRGMNGPSLLGMTFLSRLTGFSVEDGYLIMRR